MSESVTPSDVLETDPAQTDPGKPSLGRTVQKVLTKPRPHLTGSLIRNRHAGSQRSDRGGGSLKEFDVWPVLFSFYGIQVRSYGVSKAIAALIGAILLRKTFTRLGYDKDLAYSIVPWVRMRPSLISATDGLAAKSNL